MEPPQKKIKSKKKKRGPKAERRAKSGKRSDKKWRQPEDPFPGEPPVDPEKLKKYKRGPNVEPREATKYGKHQKKLEAEKRKTKKTQVQATRSELLLTEDAGYLEPDKYESTYQITQDEIKAAVDITAATKRFDLNLEYGPYRFDYSRNGRFMVMGGSRGHVAAFDWVTKDLQCEFNVQESVHDVKYLHMPTLFAVAQKDYVHLYDQQGIELHCLKPLFRIKHLDFLPFHFLLVGGSDTGYIHWIDVSIGKMVSSFRMPHSGGNFTCMAQNKWNAIMHTGHANGTVALWSPNEREPLVKMLSHASPIKGLAITDDGRHMATTGLDRSLKVWDLRTYKTCLSDYKLFTPANGLTFSQKGLLAAALGPVVEVYNNPTVTAIDAAYVRHKAAANIADINFCNYEDVIGVGHSSGFSSVLVPGAGEANFDGFEANPFMTSSQRKEMEVKMLLDKIQPELISLDPTELARVDRIGLGNKLAAKEKVKYVKKPDIEFTSDAKEMKRKQKTAKKFKIKSTLKDEAKKKEVKKLMLEEKVFNQPAEDSKVDDRPVDALKRFRAK